MLKSYFRMAWRSLLKNKVSFFVNISGLAVGLATSIIIMLVVVDEFSYDRFQTNLGDIYLVMKNQKQADGISTGSSTAGPLSGALRNEMPEVKYAAHLTYSGNQLVKVGDKTIFESAMYAEPDLFNMMSFPALEGDPVTALNDVNSVVITENTAKKFYGNEDPLGKILVLDSSHTLKVAAVLRDIPSNSSIQFDIVVPFRIFELQNAWLSKWDDNRIQTWAQLKPHANIPALNEKLTKILQVRSSDTSVSLFAYPMRNLRLFGGFDNGKPHGGKIYVVELLIILGFFILGIGCINFMNIATARSEDRGREVGVRRVLGAGRKQLIFQFLSEAILTSFLALVIGVIICYLVIPAFNQFAEKDIQFDLWNWRIWLLLLGMGLFTGLAAGIYPAFFLSKFKSVKTLKGRIPKGRGGVSLRRVLVTVQFAISIFIIISTIVIFSQIEYVRNRPIGYDQENLIDINANGNLQGNYEVFKNELSKIRGVSNVSAGSDNLLQFGSGITGLDWPGKIPGREVSILISNVQYDWIKTAGMQLVEGRDFSPSYATDSSTCLINQTTVEKLGLKEPVIGQVLGGKAIIGVFHNFVFNNPSGIIAPMAVYLSAGNLNHFFVRIRNDGQWRQTLAQIEQATKKMNPNYPFDFSFTKEGYQRRFQEMASEGYSSSLFGGIAIFISCLGVFGLSSFLAEKRSKEMSIRKVFGASISTVWLLLSRDFLKPVFIAFLVVIPLATWFLGSRLSNIAYHEQLSWWMFALAGFSVLFVSILTVSYQGIKTALENPIKNLRSE